MGGRSFSPFTEYGSVESSRWLQAALEFAGLLPTAEVEPSAVGSAAETVGQSVAVNATLPACATSEVGPILARYGPVGTVKAKVAEHGIDSLPEDWDRLREFRRLFPETTLRLDANAGYALPEALAACTEFAEFDLQYFEQPVAAVEDMARLREQLSARELPVVLAADESIRKAEDPVRVAELGAAEVVIVKVQPLGGDRCRTLSPGSLRTAGRCAVIGVGILRRASRRSPAGGHAAGAPNEAGSCSANTLRAVWARVGSSPRMLWSPLRA